MSEIVIPYRTEPHPLTGVTSGKLGIWLFLTITKCRFPRVYTPTLGAIILGFLFLAIMQFLPIPVILAWIVLAAFSLHLLEQLISSKFL